MGGSSVQFCPHNFPDVWMWMLSLPMGLVPTGVRLSELRKDFPRDRPMEEIRLPHYRLYA